jgi:type IV fimbrial biogenesis protein FimT
VLSGRRHRRAAAAAGFSLIELMVTITVLVLLLMAALPALGHWVADSRIRSVAESLQNALRQAQGAAMAQNRRSVLALTNATPALTALPAANGSRWYVRLLPLDGSDESDDPGADPNAKTRFLGGNSVAAQSNVTITGPALLCFSPLGRQTSVADSATGLTVGCTATDGATYTVAAANDAGARVLKVQVDLGGRVRMCDSAKLLSNENPDGC